MIKVTYKIIITQQFPHEKRRARFVNEQLTTLVRLSWQFAKLGNRSLLPSHY